MAEPYSPSKDEYYIPAGGSRPTSSSWNGVGANAGPAQLSVRDELLSGQQNQQGNDKQKDTIALINSEIEATKKKLAHNIEAIAERGEHLDNLNQKTEVLGVRAQMFNRQAERARRKMWWKNMKWTIAICALVCIIVIGAVVGALKGSK